MASRVRQPQPPRSPQILRILDEAEHCANEAMRIADLLEQADERNRIITKLSDQLNEALAEGDKLKRQLRAAEQGLAATDRANKDGLERMRRAINCEAAAEARAVATVKDKELAVVREKYEHSRKRRRARDV